ncbi:MAG: ABC transporter substrate-binding protein [Blastocatellia bacterium]|nr:ABC transporter substrate-binding protein [Blastocatellia bacterium]
MKIKAFWVIVVLLALATAACRPSSTPQETASQERQIGASGGRLVVADRGTPKTFNYLLAGDVVSATIASYLMSSALVEMDHDTQAFVPGLAESWQASDGGKTITIKLREGLKFSDGTPITADDFLFTLKVAVDEKSGALFRENFLSGDQPLKATKIDDRTFKLEQTAPSASIESFLAIFRPLPRHKLEAAYTQGEFSKAWGVTTAAADLVVSGAFMLKEYAPDQRTVLARNPNYWKKDKAGTQLPYLDELVIEAIPDANTALLKFQQGEVDLLDNLAPANFATLKQQTPAGLTVKDYGPSMLTDFLWFNVNDGKDATGKPFVEAAKRAWFADARFRRAIATALDRTTIINNVLRGLGTPISGLASPSNKRWFSSELPKYDFDLQKAKGLLQEAGFVERDKTLVDKAGQPVEFTIVVDGTVAVRKEMATIIQEDLSKLGIKVNVAPLEKNAFVEMISKKLSYDAAIHGYAPSDAEPSTLVSGLKIGGGQRYWFMGQKQAREEWEKTFDQLAEDIDSNADSAVRKQKFDAVQKLFAEQLPMIPLVVRNFASGAKTNLGNYRPSVIIPRSLWNADELFWRK